MLACEDISLLHPSGLKHLGPFAFTGAAYGQL